MTCIIGFVDDEEHIYIVGDSAGGGAAIGPDMVKVWKHTDDGGVPWLFGASGHARAIQLAQFIFLPKSLGINANGLSRRDILGILIGVVAQKLHEISKKYEVARTAKDASPDRGYGLVLGVGRYMFVLSSDGTVRSVEDNRKLCCLGVGGPHAVGAMSILVKDPNILPEEALEEAMRVSADWNPGDVQAPFHIVSTKPEEP